MAEDIARTSERDELVGCLTDLWQCFDELFDPFTETDWAREHGDDWTYADLPYHLAYFDRDVVARSLEDGPELPIEDRWLMQSLNEINGWNAAVVSKRPAGQTAQDALREWHESRDAILRAIQELSDADLDREAWSPFTGVTTNRYVVASGVTHTWNHLNEARLRLGNDKPVPATATTTRVLAFYADLMADTSSAEAVSEPFTAVLDFPGFGAWTIRVANGDAIVSEGLDEGADFTMTQSPETFGAVLAGLQNPMLAMLTRKIRVKGILKMPTFGKVFSQPTPDQLLFPRPEGFEEVRIYS